MTASEKLKALAHDARPQPLLTVEGVAANVAILDALPLIADVVEAAERFAEVNGAAWPEVRDSLTALREHLEEGERNGDDRQPDEGDPLWGPSEP